jgi:hypothetical protein
MEFIPVIISTFSLYFLRYVTRAGVICDPNGYYVDATDPEFDRDAGWFRAHPSLPELITKFLDDVTKTGKDEEDYSPYPFSDGDRCKTQKVPRCLIPFCRREFVDYGYPGCCDKMVYDHELALKTVIHEELLRPVDPTLPVEEQLSKVKENQANFLSRLAELDDGRIAFERGY